MTTKDGQRIIFHNAMNSEEALIRLTTEERDLTPDEIDDAVIHLNSEDFQIHIIDNRTPKSRDTIIGAAKWISRIAQRYEQLPQSFTDNIPAEAIASLTEKLRGLVKKDDVQPKEGQSHE